VWSALVMVVVGVGPAGCTAGADPAGPPTVAAVTGSPSVAAGIGDPPATGFARDGFYVTYSFGAIRFRTQMLGIERFPGYSVLRFKLTNLEQERQSGLFLFGTGGIAQGFGGFDLVDSVNRKIYYALRAEHGSGHAFGSRDTWFEPGIAYEGFVYYPALPATVTRMTVLSHGSPGLYAGIPVVDGTEPPKAATAPPDPPGPSPMLESVLPQGTVWSVAADLIGMTENEVGSTSTSATEETIGLRTDVLFAFDSATLSAKAKAVLDEVAAETRARADPAKPPIIVTGHTDAKGTTAYNLKLSRQRADAVRRELQTRLGGGYQYRASGAGESQPIAKEGGADDERARARNRRVEISYQIKQSVPATTTTTTPGVQPATGPIAPPAEFRLDDRIVTERTATVEGVGYRLRLPPAYRDGAYLVVPVEFIRDRPLPAGRPETRFDDLTSGCVGAFTQLRAVDPATGSTLLRVEQGTRTDRVPFCLDGAGGGITPDLPVQTYVYLPAPAAGTTTITLDAGPFGRIADLPVE
jgi:outer membrane protein OmpA-like peptidoglycan-associated protein